MKRILPLLFILAIFSTGCATTDAQINEIGLWYSDGVTEDREFQGIIQPGANFQSIGFGDVVYKYPNDQRNYIIDRNPNVGDVLGEDLVPLVVGNVPMQAEVQIYMTLNQDPAVLQAFHENIGLRTKAYNEGGETSAGWSAMLAQFFRPQIERAMAAAAGTVESAANETTNRDIPPWRLLYSNEQVRNEFQAQAAERIPALIEAALGGPYFCGPDYTGYNPETETNDECGTISVTIKRPEPPVDLVSALVAEQNAALAVDEQEQQNLRISAEVNAQREQVELFGADNYVLLQAIEAGNIPFLTIPEGSLFSVPAGVIPSAPSE